MTRAEYVAFQSQQVRDLRTAILASDDAPGALLALAADDELLDLTQRTLATREDSLRLTQLKVDNGVSSELDLRQAQSLVAKLQPYAPGITKTLVTLGEAGLSALASTNPVVSILVATLRAAKGMLTSEA